MTDNIPNDAVSIWYVADNGKKGTYHLWNRKDKLGNRTFHWHALGHSGEELDAIDATTAARRFIRNGIASIKRDQ